MQHWTLCEVLSIANRHHSTLNYIDAHAMAPLATTRTAWDEVFDRALDGLPTGQSKYEKAWYRLSRIGNSYPGSANLLSSVWNGNFYLLLCEIRRSAAREIRYWLDDLQFLKGRKRTELYQGDWRERFLKPLPSPVRDNLLRETLSFLSFDPYYISKSHARFKGDEGALYPQDLDTIGTASKGLPGPVLIQLSTYTARGGNSQGVIIRLVDGCLGQFGFERVAKTHVDGNMMSLIYVRDVAWAHELATLGSRFSDWLARC